MSAAVSQPDIERFRAAIARRMGLEFDDAKLGLLGEVLRRRLDKRRAHGSDYLASLETAPPPDECSALAEELTVTETYFFRNHEQFDALAAVVLPDRHNRRQDQRRLRLLSAGCASGEEAYSLAIATADFLSEPGWQVEIGAIDLNPAALAKARRGRYSAWALRETSPAQRRRWFTKDEQQMAVDEDIRRSVHFDCVNLADPGAALWSGGGYDVIFCRNVLMYFSPEQRRAAIERLACALLPGGYLFLGHAESLTGQSGAFRLHHTHNTFYYQRNDTDGAVPVPPPAPPTIKPGLPDCVWTDSIHAASERIARLLPDETAPPRPAAAPGSGDLTPALELLRRERFADALAYVAGRKPAAESPDSLLLNAVLLQQSGQLSEAEEACRRLLALDGLSAGAHYVLALCRESAGDLAAGAEHDRIAVYLDPAFAMPRLHLGLLARRAGDREAARRELAQALILLESEDPARLLLFGGGFNRKALIGLCRSTLRDCGGRP